MFSVFCVFFAPCFELEELFSTEMEFGNSVYTPSLFCDPRHAGTAVVQRGYLFLTERKQGKIGREVKSKLTQVMESGIDNE